MESLLKSVYEDYTIHVLKKIKTYYCVLKNKIRTKHFECTTTITSNISAIVFLRQWTYLLPSETAAEAFGFFIFFGLK